MFETRARGSAHGEKPAREGPTRHHTQCPHTPANTGVSRAKSGGSQSLRSPRLAPAWVQQLEGRDVRFGRSSLAGRVDEAADGAGRRQLVVDLDRFGRLLDSYLNSCGFKQSQ